MTSKKIQFFVGLTPNVAAVELKTLSSKILSHQAPVTTLPNPDEIPYDPQQLQTIPGVGPMTAMAIEAFALPMETLKNGRAFAAWLGLVPRQFSSGGKERLGRVSKAGQSDIRRLLIIGAMTRMNWLGRRSITAGSWLSRMIVRKPRLLVAIALANKMSRIIWAMLTKGTDY